MAKILINECEHCGKKFPTIYPKQKYCTKKCRKEAQKLKAESKGQLCWRCKNACGKCSWSRSLTPVNNWTAKEVIVNDSAGNYSTYSISACPEYIQE